MFKLFEKLFPQPKKKVLSRIDRLTYAVGDIHGCATLLENMLIAIREDAKQFDEKPRVILLGDYIDRGNASKRVFDRLLKLQQESWCDLILLMGNHEESLLNFLRERHYGVAWSEHGGDATMMSYGVRRPINRGDTEGWLATHVAFLSQFPEDHRRLLQDMQLTFIAEDYLFVHAGVKPNQPLETQGPKTFLWIRSEFLSSPKACEYVVVHGHTPEPQVSNLRWRIGLDTGAYATGVLSAIRLQGETRHIIQVR